LASHLLFGEKTKAKFDMVASDLSPYFSLSEVPGASIPVYTMKLHGNPCRNPDLVEKIPPEIIVYLARAEHGYWKKHVCQAVLDHMSKVERSPSWIYPFIASLECGVNVLADPSESGRLRRVSKDIEDHAGMRRMASEMSYKTFRIVNDMVKEFRKEIGLHIDGYLDNAPPSIFDKINDAQNDAGVIRKILLQFFEEQEAFEAERESNAKYLLGKRFEPFFFEGYLVKELRTSKDLYLEGLRMHHCVGGYTHRVFSGSSAILSMQKNNVQDCLTLQVHPTHMFGEMEIIQLHGVSNRSATIEEWKTAERLVLALNIRRSFGRFAVFGMQFYVGLARLFPFGTRWLWTPDVRWIFNFNFTRRLLSFAKKIKWLRKPFLKDFEDCVPF
jgi:hypothetical protein